jgi:acetoacetyl-CoA synthetase
MHATSASQGHQTPLYQPPSPESSRIFKFLRNVNTKYDLSLSSYFDLYKWSCTQLDQFWGTVWDETGVIGHKGNHIVDSSTKPPANPPWFSDAQVNWAENMLQCRLPGKTAVIQACA